MRMNSSLGRAGSICGPHSTEVMWFGKELGRVSWLPVCTLPTSSAGAVHTAADQMFFSCVLVSVCDLTGDKFLVSLPCPEITLFQFSSKNVVSRCLVGHKVNI